MKFELTEEQNLIRDMVREFAEKEIAPSAEERDEDERFDRDLMFGRLAELGLTGIVFPEEYGGAGADYISYPGLPCHKRGTTRVCQRLCRP